MDVKKILSQLTLEEKASLTVGKDFWHTQPVERLGVPSVMVTDGPHGLRKQGTSADHLGIAEAIPATCFPTACATAASWNRESLFKEGQALGNECQAENVAVLLGPGASLKRSPLCGRNFEYFSEDPYLSSQLAANHIKGVESKGVGTSVKHFFANNQECRRMTNNSQVDERTMHEIYLRSFEDAVREGKPATVMCSYNRINGVYAAHNHYALTHVLRDLWGFEGIVVSDWGAVDNRVEDIKAGLDLEMPFPGSWTKEQVIRAVQDGSLNIKDLDTVVERILNFLKKYTESHHDEKADLEGHHQLAKEIECDSIVLLKNQDNILPLKKEQKVLYVGPFAKKPRFQGGGSSHINPFKLGNALDASKNYQVEYAEGYLIANQDDEKLLNEAVEAAKRNDVVVVFCGLTDAYESEGFDRKHLNMPDNQNKLISALAAVNPNIVVALHNGSPILMPWLDSVKGVLEAYIGGQAVSEAIVSVLFGEVNPSGRLPETFPKRIEDTPCFGNYPGDRNADEVLYGERVFVGYRWYDYRKIEPLFPFGFGLSYTTFEFSNLRLSAQKIKEGETLDVTVAVKNTGSVAGKEVVQLYVGMPDGKLVERPVRELREFAKVELQPGETKDVTFHLNRRAFAYWSTPIHDWHVESGVYRIDIGYSSRNIGLTANVEVESAVPQVPFRLSLDTMGGLAITHPKVGGKLSAIFARVKKAYSGDENKQEADMMDTFLFELPIRGWAIFMPNLVTIEELVAVIAEGNI